VGAVRISVHEQTASRARNFADQNLLSGVQPGVPLRISKIWKLDDPDDDEDKTQSAQYERTAATTPGEHTITVGGDTVTYEVVKPENAEVRPVKTGNDRWNLPTNMLTTEQLAEKIQDDDIRESIGLPTSSSSGSDPSPSSSSPSSTSNSDQSLSSIVPIAIGAIVVIIAALWSTN
jgi:hypothetical protein